MICRFCLIRGQGFDLIAVPLSITCRVSFKPAKNKDKRAREYTEKGLFVSISAWHQKCLILTSPRLATACQPLTLELSKQP